MISIIDVWFFQGGRGLTISPTSLKEKAKQTATTWGKVGLCFTSIGLMLNLYKGKTRNCQ